MKTHDNNYSLAPYSTISLVPRPSTQGKARYTLFVHVHKFNRFPVKMGYSHIPPHKNYCKSCLCHLVCLIQESHTALGIP